MPTLHPSSAAEIKDLFVTQTGPQSRTANDRTGLTTRTGFEFTVRPASPEDQAALDGLFSHLTPDDLRYRFLSPVKRVGPDVLALMTHVDHKQSEDFLGFNTANGRLIANAMLAASPGGETAEVALAMDRDYKHKGISWTLLQHVIQVAKARGIKKLQSIEDRGHKDAIALEREIGFKAGSYPGDATLMLLEADLQAQQRPDEHPDSPPAPVEYPFRHPSERPDQSPTEQPLIEPDRYPDRPPDEQPSIDPEPEPQEPLNHR